MIYNPTLIFKKYIIKYERYIGITSILLGFIWDSITFAHPDQLFGNLVLILYLILSAFGILLLSLYKKKGEVIPVVLLAIIQFAFGNIAGSFLFLYGKSGTFEGSSLFLLILGAFVVGNEFIREHYTRITFHVSVWYFLSLLYLTFVIPMILGEMGNYVFAVSGIASLVLIGVFLGIIFLTNKEVISKIKKIFFSILTIFVLFNALYFLNIIPPVPLSLQEIGIYHLVEKTNKGSYRVLYEEPRWFDFFNDTSKVFNKQLNESTYCFSSVFAPVKLSTNINHKWEYYDNVESKWQISSIISFPIEGGREGGYRGYSKKLNLRPGLWRCSTETASGALIGRTTFTVVDSNKISNLKEEEK
ncbi:MAG: hypothetical protein LiPW30_571 [Parcubacteria group bacterium LiPW_30]|nr:MAG: hypothetical protein LiPW30_571 [Parcubacteria group bacterium LiPW_30]